MVVEVDLDGRGTPCCREGGREGESARREKAGGRERDTHREAGSARASTVLRLMSKALKRWKMTLDRRFFLRSSKPRPDTPTSLLSPSRCARHGYHRICSFAPPRARSLYTRRPATIHGRELEPRHVFRDEGGTSNVLPQHNTPCPKASCPSSTHFHPSPPSLLLAIRVCVSL